MLHVVAAVDEVASQCVQQLRITWWVRTASIVNRMNDATPKEVTPHAIDHRACKKWIVRGGHPASQRHARVIETRHLKIRTTERSRAHHFSSAGMSDFAFVLQEDRFARRNFGVGEASLATNASEHRSQ